MKFDKIIYFSYVSLTKKMASDFYMLEVEKVGVKAEYWDISKLYFEETTDDVEDSSNIIKTIKFTAFQQFAKAVENEVLTFNSLFISIVSYTAFVKKIFEILTNNNAKTAVFGRNMMPMGREYGNDWLSEIKHLNFSKLIRFIKNKFAVQQKKAGKIKGYDIIFIGGEKGWKGIGGVDYSEVEKAKLIKINSNDYDDYLVHKDDLPIIKKDYILFLDQCMPMHPDAKFVTTKSVPAELYYPDLCAYFTRIEQKYNMPVVIAAHPKALKYKERNYFEGRQIIFDQTAVLSKYAYFVLAHDTTAINYPIAYGTRIHFITFDALEKIVNSSHQTIIRFANFLGCNFQYFNRTEEEINVVEEVSKSDYERYKYVFQTWPETENKHSKDIFLETITNS